MQRIAIAGMLALAASTGVQAQSNEELKAKLDQA